MGATSGIYDMLVCVCLYCMYAYMYVCISIGEGWQGGCSPPQLGKNLFNSGNFSEITIESSSNFSGCSPGL